MPGNAFRKKMASYLLKFGIHSISGCLEMHSGKKMVSYLLKSGIHSLKAERG
jgi:hypothetical protein